MDDDTHATLRALGAAASMCSDALGRFGDQLAAAVAGRLRLRDLDVDFTMLRVFDPMRVIDFPSEWATGEPIDSACYSQGGDLYLCGACLDDGSNLWALVYPGGHRFARVAEATGWALEERYEGDPPQTAEVDALWREWLGVMIEVGHEVDKMFRP